MIVITAQIKSRFVEENPIPFRCSPIPSSMTPLQKKAMVSGYQQQYTQWCRDSKCSSVRRLAKIPADIETCSEVAA
ncbi:hypothetical protein TNCV_4252591 [Trichonephila clavipes]|nr:hypothetical protein TNCV_4252591 [Trichonephila clavipes]